MRRDIKNIVDKGFCIGCGLCEAIHGEDCKMQIGRDGFYKPLFNDEKKFKSCDVVPRLCPGINMSCNHADGNHSSIWGDVRSSSIAWAKDEAIRETSSSGGVISALALYLLDSKRVDGILHVGVDEGGYLHNQLFVSTTKADVLSRNASRYAPAAVLNKIKEILDTDPTKTYAFIGKPCDIAGLRNFIAVYPEYEGRIKYFLSIFCGGMPSYNATERALATFGRKDKLVSLRYRGNGWPGYFTATYSDGTSEKMTYNDSWGKILGRDVSFRCKICPDGIGLLADIATGDAWNTKNGYPDFTEAKGRNFCFIRSNKGVELFEAARQAGYIEAEDLALERVKEMQPYQYNRRFEVGWRLLGVQLLTMGMLRFRGIGYYRAAAHFNILRGAKQCLGTMKRFVRARSNG